MKRIKVRNTTLVHETSEKCCLEEHHFVNEALREEIKKKAYELYEGRGCVSGNEIEDWLEAERLIIQRKEECNDKRSASIG